MNYDRYDSGATLCEFKSTNSSERFCDLIFPVEAYVAVLRKLKLPLPKAWERFETVVQPTEIPKQIDSADVAPPQTSPTFEPKDDYEVVPCITLGDLRALLDEKNEGSTFCPVLLAAIRAAIGVKNLRTRGPDSGGFNWSPMKQKTDIAEEVNRQLIELRIFTGNAAAKGKEKNSPSKEDKDAVIRCCRLERIQPNR